MLRNYYTIYDLSKNRIGFFESAWTLKSRKLSIWGILFLSLLGLILRGGIIGCFRKGKISKKEKEFRMRALSGEIPGYQAVSSMGS